MGNGLCGLGGDPGFEPFEIISHGIVLKAGVNAAHGLELEPEPAAGKMDAEDVEDGRPGEDGQLGPDGQEPSIVAQQPTGPTIGSLPGDVATKVKCQTLAQGCPGASQELDRLCRRQVAAQEQRGLGMRAKAAVEPARERPRDVSGTLDQGTNRQPLAEQPVHPGDVRPQVAAHQDHTPAGRDRCLEEVVAYDVKTLEERGVRSAVERIVTGQEPCRIGRQVKPKVLDRPVQFKSALDPRQGTAQPRPAPRPDRRQNLA